MKYKGFSVLSKMMLITLLFISMSMTGCIKCSEAYTLEVVNDSGNMLPIHASIDGDVGSEAPRIEPGSSHSFSFSAAEDGTEETDASATLTISRDGSVLGTEHVFFGKRNMKVVVFDAVTGGVAFEIR